MAKKARERESFIANASREDAWLFERRRNLIAVE